MPSILTQYENVDFIAGKPFVYNGTVFDMGDDVPDAKRYGNLESMVRSRRLIPVVDEYSKAPFQFRRTVMTRELALRKLGLGEGGLRQTGLSQTKNDDPEPLAEGEFNPAEHTADQVLDHVDEYPDELLSVYALEEKGKARSTLLKKLDDRLNRQVETEEGTSNV